jgi:hypothetical protein
MTGKHKEKQLSHLRNAHQSALKREKKRQANNLTCVMYEAGTNFTCITDEAGTFKLAFSD